MTYDALGNAAVDKLHAFLRAKEPTHQLTHNLIDAVATLIANRTGEPVSMQIGSLPAFRRVPAARRAA